MNQMRRSLVAGFAALLSCSAALPAHAQGLPSRGRAIQFSDPKVEVVTSNLNHAASIKKNTLRSLDDQFKAPFNILDSSEAAGSQLSLPTLRPPSLTPKAARQLSDKQKEEEQWIFGSPEELEAQRLSAERMFGLTEFDESGMETSGSKSPLQRYWDKMDRERAGATNRMGSELSGEKTDQDIKDQAKAMFNLPSLSTETSPDSPATAAKSSLTPTLANSLSAEVSAMRSSSELFSTPLNNFTPQKSEASLGRINEFKQLFADKNLGAGGALGSPPAAAFSRPSSGAGFATTPAATWRPASAAPVSSFGSLPGSSLSKPGFPASSYNPTPPLLPQPTRTIAPPVGFQLPKRSF